MGRIDSDLKRITSEPWLVWQCWWATFSARAKWRSVMSAGSSVEKKYLTGSGVVREAMLQQLRWHQPEALAKTTKNGEATPTNVMLPLQWQTDLVSSSGRGRRRRTARLRP